MSNPRNIILILLSLALFYMFISPQYAEVSMLRTSAGEYENVLDNVERIEETRDRLIVDYNAISSAEFDRLKKILPDSIDTVQLALDLDTIASRYGISIKDVRVETGGDKNAALAVLPESGTKYDRALVTFSFISNYPNFIKMLADLEKSLRIMDVRSASFEVSTSGLYEHFLTVETYWLK